MHKRLFLCHAVDVRMCSEEHRSKGFRRNLSLLVGGKSVWGSSWFLSSIYICAFLWPSILVTCPTFDNLPPELGLSIRVNVVSGVVKEAYFRLAGARDLIHEPPVVLGLFVEFWLLMFQGSDWIFNCLIRSDILQLIIK